MPCRELDFFKIFFEKNCLEFVLGIFWEFFLRRYFLGGIVWEKFFGKNFLGEIFGRIYLGVMFWKEFFEGNSLEGILCLHCGI